MREMCRWRHRTGNVFAGIREFRAVATRKGKAGRELRRGDSPRGGGDCGNMIVDRP